MDRFGERLIGKGVGVDVFDFGWDLGDLVGSGVEDRDLVPALEQPVYDEVPGRTGTANHQCTHADYSPASRAAIVRSIHLR